MSKWFGSVVQICGAVCVTIGSYMIVPAAGWLVGGAFMVVIGVPPRAWLSVTQLLQVVSARTG